MKEINDECTQITYKMRKQICLYLFQNGIGYRRASKLLGLKMYTVKDYHRRYSQGNFSFAYWNAHEPKDAEFLKVVKMIPHMKNSSIADICKKCGVQYSRILVYSYDYEKEKRNCRSRYYQCIESGSDSSESFCGEAIGVGCLAEQNPYGIFNRLDKRSGNRAEVQSRIKKKRLAKVESLIKDGIPINKACAASKIARSSYYRSKVQTKKQTSDKMLAVFIKEIQEKLCSKYSYGIERMTAEVNRCINEVKEDVKGIILNGSSKINHKRIERVMKTYDLNAHIKRAKMPKNYYKARHESEEHNKAPNIVKRNFFDIKENGKLLVTDVTYLPRMEGGFIYLSALMDLANQEIISFEISSENSAAMAERTLRNITGKVACGCVVHSDQGAVYKSNEWITTCRDLGITRSMSRKGNCWDNAVIENFFSRMKSDIHITKRHSKNLFTGKELREMVTSYIYWYNHSRIQKRLGFLSPIDYRKKLEAEQLTNKTENVIISAI